MMSGNTQQKSPVLEKSYAGQPARGKFIVLYGINNLGKTTQARLLTEKLNNSGVKTEYIKYPVYELRPSGVLLDNYLRRGNAYKLSPREAQIVYALNRTQYEPVLRQKLTQGITVVAEDYIGTGLAWGLGTNVDEQFLKYINSNLIKEDLAILMNGRRFPDGIEARHEHEKNDDLINRVRLMHLKLAEEYGWPVVDANQTVDSVQAAIWVQAQKKLNITGGGANFKAELINATEKGRNPDILMRRAAGENSMARNALLVSKTTPDAKIPTRAHADDAGLDLYANDDYTLFVNDIVSIGTGVNMAIPSGHAGMIWDKSGLAVKGLKTMGGVIDAGYRGEVKVVITNLSGDVVHIAKGQKIAQIIIQKIEAPDIKETDALDETKRQNNGFGSTGLY